MRERERERERSLHVGPRELRCRKTTVGYWVRKRTNEKDRKNAPTDDARMRKKTNKPITNV